MSLFPTSVLSALLSVLAFTSLFTTMIFTRVIACVSMLMLAVGASAEEAAAQPTELKIDRTYVPEDCKVTAQQGDKLHMHYVSTGVDCYPL